MKNIMVVEDDDDIRSVLESVLAEEGYSVSAFENLPSAYASLQAAPRGPDLILLDYMFPGGNSGRFLDSVRDHGSASQVPVLLMSAGNNYLLGDSAERANGFISKPIHIDTLLMEIEKLIPAAVH